MPKLPFTPDRGFVIQARLTCEVIGEYTKPSILEAADLLVRQAVVEPVWHITAREAHRSWRHRSYGHVTTENTEEVISRSYKTDSLATALQYFVQEICGVELLLPPTAAEQLRALSEKIERDHDAGAR